MGPHCSRILISQCLIAAAILASPGPHALAVCPSGLPNEIFCDDYDCYCAAADCSQDPPLRCQEGSAKANGPMRQVWVLTSRNEANNNICGSEFNIEDTLEVFSEPFGNGLPNQQGAQLGHMTVTIKDEIASTFGPAYEAVAGTDANPLIMSMNLQNQAASTSRREHSQNVYYELVLGDDFAPTDYVSRQQECTDCGVSVTQDWARVLCAQSVQVPGCPDITPPRSTRALPSDRSPISIPIPAIAGRSFTAPRMRTWRCMTANTGTL